MPPPHGKGNTDSGCHLAHQIGKSLAALVRGRNIEVYQFVGTLLAVGLSQFYGIAGSPKIDKMNALDGLAVFDIQTGNNPLS
jgi:hypothetical protein